MRGPDLRMSPTRRRSLILVHYGAEEVAWVRAEYCNGAWAIEESASGCVASPGLIETPPPLVANTKAPRCWVVVVLEPEHYETRLVRYPRTAGKRLGKILEYDLSEHALRPPDKLLFYYAAPHDDGSMLSLPFYAMERTLHTALMESFKTTSMGNVHILPDAILLPQFWRRLCPGAPHGVLMRERGALASGYSIVSNAVAEALVFSPDSPLTQLWSAKIAQRGLYVPVVHLHPDRERQTRESLHAAPPEAQSACLVAPWAVEMTQSLLHVDPVRTFEGELRIAPKRLSCAIWILALLALAHCAFFALASRHRDVQVEILAANKSAVLELRRTWEPLRKQSELFRNLQESEKRLAALEAASIPLEPLFVALTELTPKNTWLREARLEGNRLTLYGEAPEALAYRTILASQEMFSNVEFEGSITKSRDIGREQFVMSLDVDNAALKADRKARTKP